MILKIYFPEKFILINLRDCIVSRQDNKQGLISMAT